MCSLNVMTPSQLHRGSLLVFRVRREDGEGDVRILHRNLLLPSRTRIPEEEPDPPSPSLYSSSNPVVEPEESLKDTTITVVTPWIEKSNAPVNHGKPK